MAQPNHPAADIMDSSVRSCGDCERSFVNELDLLIHRKRTHDVNRYACKICGRRFSRNPNLIRHVALVHKDSSYHIPKRNTGDCRTAAVRKSLPAGFQTPASKKKQVHHVTRSAGRVTKPSVVKKPARQKKMVPVSEQEEEEAQTSQLDEEPLENVLAELKAIANQPETAMQLQVKQEVNVSATSASLSVKAEPVINQSAGNGTFECTILPMVAVIYKFAAINKEETMLIWETDLSPDLALAISENADKCLLLLKDSGDFCKTSKIFGILQKYKATTMTFSLMTSTSHAVQWSLISFAGDPMPTELANKLFKSYGEIESSVKTNLNRNNLKNILRYSNEGFANDNKHQLVHHTVYCSCDENANIT